MGVLGWTEKDTLDASLQGIVAALESRKRFINDILQAVFGSPTTESAEPVAQTVRPMTPELFDALFS